MKKFILALLTFLIFLNYTYAEEEIREARALVTATEKVSISSELAARVENINFLLGDPFKKGDVLISFDCKIYKAQKEVIQANYDLSLIHI